MTDNRKGRWKRRLWIAGAAALVVAGGVWYWQRGHDDAPQYQTEAVERGDLTQVITATGTLNPVTNVLVGCQVSGRISKLFVDFNSHVKEGQLIAQIDPRSYEAQVEQATADLASAKANLELQQVEAQRSGNLFTNKLISESDYDTALANLHEAEAAVQIKEAALSNAKANLGYCDIYSPVDGIVISRSVDVGQTVAASLSAPTLFQIANDLKRMQIDANVDEADVGGVREGQDVDFTVDAYPDHTFHGAVRQVRNAPITVNNVVTYDSVIAVTNADLKLKPGMTANVSIIAAEHRNVLEIPNSALRFQPPENALVDTNAPGARFAAAGNRAGRANGPGGRGAARGARARGNGPALHAVYVLRPGADGNAAMLEPVQIKTGITDNIDTEVLSGLKEGDRVVTGLEIPGLTSNEQTRNPFTFRRHF
ncbi:MAG: efflux RND transporter periplasmic adaptor subunit [Verrucomicrobiota bacterium]|nr:efflux RND transporter periplasmic adaptor subunit [Verrucomicrobiota bacterium]